MDLSYKPGDLASLFGSKPVIYNPQSSEKTSAVGGKRAALENGANNEPSKKRLKLTPTKAITEQNGASNEQQSKSSKKKNRNKKKNKNKNKNNNNDNSNNEKSNATVTRVTNENTNEIQNNEQKNEISNNDKTDNSLFYPNLKIKSNIGRGRARTNTRLERREKHLSKMKQIRIDKKIAREKGHKLLQTEKLTMSELDDRKEKTQRTLFIGNIPNYWKKKHIKKFLSKWVNFIEEIYFSNYINAKLKYINKQMKNKRKNQLNDKFMAKNEIAENKSNKNAWVRFKSKEYVSEAISLNNTIIDNKFTLRVDYADPSLTRNNEKCVFIGGLPTNANEDDIRTFFNKHLSTNEEKSASNADSNANNNDNSETNNTESDNSSNNNCIVNVRILRNPETQISRGCGFVEFDTMDNVSKALDLHLSKFEIPNFAQMLAENGENLSDEEEQDDNDINESIDDIISKKNSKKKKKKKSYKIIRVVPCVRNPQQLNPKKDKIKEHYKNVLSIYPTTLRGDKGQVIAKFDTKAQNTETKEFFHKGRDKYMRKMRWKDHPELKQRSLQRRAKKLKISIDELKRRLQIKKENPNSNVKINPNDDSDDDDDVEYVNHNNNNNNKNDKNNNHIKNEKMNDEKNNNNKNNTKDGKKLEKLINKDKANKWGTNLNEKKENILKQQASKRIEIKHKKYLKRQRMKKQIQEQYGTNGDANTKVQLNGKGGKQKRKGFDEKEHLDAMGQDFDVDALGKDYGFGDDSDPNDGNEYGTDDE